jgi:hypothetical protein
LAATAFGRWNPVGAAKIFGEALGPFELRGGAARPECLDPGGLEIVDNARAEGRFGSDHHQVDSALAAEGDHAGMVGQIERHTLRLLRNAGIARSAIKTLHQRTIRHFPSQSVLSPAGT